HACDERVPAPATLARWWVLLLAAATCFGTGIALALVFPIVAWLLLPATPAAARAAAVLALLWLTVPLLYLADHWLWVRFYGGHPQAVVLGSVQWREPVAPAEMLAGLLAHGIAAVHLGFVWPRADVPAFVWWAVVAGYAAAVAGVLVVGPRSRRRAVLAVLLIATATYAAIATGRGNLYLMFGPTATPFSTAATPRYHYLGTLALVVITCLGADAAAERLRAPSWA